MPVSKYELNRMKEKLLEKIDYAPSGCWIWTGATGKSAGKIPYPYFLINSKRFHVRRVSYLVYCRTPPAGQYALDLTCNNPLCVNPKHLVRSIRRKSNGPVPRRVRL